MDQGVRVGWDEVPRPVRAAVESLVGGEVVVAVNETGGFSPGLAARCRLADGRRCFVKAVSTAQNPDSPSFHRREGDVAAALSADLPVPRLLGRFDDGDWVALVYEEVDGCQPALPWTMDELGATFDALARLAEATTPCRIPGLGSVDATHGELFSGFRKLAGGGDGDPDRIHPALRPRLEQLAALESGWAEAAAGASLLHFDLRADNVLVRTDGSVVLVDWPHAAIGAAWVDVVLLLPSVGLDGGPTPQEVIRRFDLFTGVEPEAVDRVLAALTGFFAHGATLPDPPGIPTVRAFQQAQADVATAWLLERLGWSASAGAWRLRRR